MISNQILQNTLDGLKNISRSDFCVADTEGKILAFTAQNPEISSSDILGFAASPADSQVVQGNQFFKVYDENRLEYVLVVSGGSEDIYMIGQMAAFQIQNLLVAYKERFDKDNFIKNLLLDNLLLVDIYNRAKKLHIEVEAKRVVFILETAQGKDYTALENVKNIFQGKKGDFITAVDEKSIIVVKEVNPGDGYAEMQKIAESILQAVREKDELITRHGAIMDKYDPKKEVGMIVDEWGTWFEVEPGTNPGFLYQQNTMRDALVAGINLNIFNKHSDRVKMANIAQMINVLQAVILTEGSKMIKTPTYHVFDMYKYHQDADLLDSTLETETVGLEEENMVPNLSESVSIDADGVMHITMTNLDLEHAYPIETTILGKKVDSIEAQIVAQEMHAKNTFEDPENVVVQSFEGVEKAHAGIKFTIPACSVLHIALK